MVSWALLWYTVGLVGHSLLEVLARAFYALHDTKTPALVGAAAMGLCVVFSLLFSDWFARLGLMPLGGLALSLSLSTALESTTLLILMHRRIGGLEGRATLRAGLLSLLAAAGMGAGLWAWLSLSAGHSYWVITGVGVILGGLLYGLLVLALGVPEARSGFAWLRVRINKGIRRF
jgi:putative peptidoglycan lipid II flippase